MASGTARLRVRIHPLPYKILIDTSPFFGGAPHLAWVVADALIILSASISIQLKLCAY
jgi:hypothetical protein